MANYYMNYIELTDLLEEYIALSEHPDFYEAHKAELLSALTGDFREQEPETPRELMELWDNQLREPSQLLLGNKYISVKAAFLEFLKVAFQTGFLEEMIRFFVEQGEAEFPFRQGSVTVFRMYLWFQSIADLTDGEICVYLQAMTHYREYRGFTLEQLKAWMPEAEHPRCNMHRENCDCDHRSEGDLCDLWQGEALERTVEALSKKGILIKNVDGLEEAYCFIR